MNMNLNSYGLSVPDFPSKSRNNPQPPIIRVSPYTANFEIYVPSFDHLKKDAAINKTALNTLNGDKH